ncbi:MAG: hypothetical protein AAGI68_10595 [Planctomycetota bacterium]
MRTKLAGTMLLSGALLLGTAGCETVGIQGGFGTQEPSNPDEQLNTTRSTNRWDAGRQAQLEEIIDERDRLAAENAELRAEVRRLQGQ